MWLRLEPDRLRVCPECGQLCLRVDTYFDEPEDESDDPLIACRHCVDDIVDALPDDLFRKLAVPKDSRVGRQHPEGRSGPYIQPTLFEVMGPLASEFVELQIAEVSDKSH